MREQDGNGRGIWVLGGELGSEHLNPDDRRWKMTGDGGFQ
jgi:hypothetical protein